MKHSSALIWKEWRQQRWYLVAALIFFVGWPLILTATSYLRGKGFKSVAPVAMVFSLGWLYALLSAVGATAQDLSEPLVGFWRSRPVRLGSWVVTKYLMGVGIMVAVFSGALILQAVVRPLQSGIPILGYLTGYMFTLILVYTLSFLSGCLVREPVYAALLSLAATLLVYFLPALVPPLGDFSVINLLNEGCPKIVELDKVHTGKPALGDHVHFLRVPWGENLALQWGTGWVKYVLFVMASGGIALGVSWLSVMRNWRVRAGQRLLCWMLGGVVLLLFSTFVFQNASNLLCVQKIPLDAFGSHPDNGVTAMTFDGHKGLLLRYSKPQRDVEVKAQYCLQPFTVSDLKVDLGKQMVLRLGDTADELPWPLEAWRIAWSPERPEWVYFLEEPRLSGGDGRLAAGSFRLHAIRLRAEVGKAEAGGSVDLLDRPSTPTKPERAGGRIALRGDTIYVRALDKLLLVGVTEPNAPRVMRTIQDYGLRGLDLAEGSRTIRLPLVPGGDLPMDERLRLTAELMGPLAVATDGKVFVVADKTSVRTYRVKESDGEVATLEMVRNRRSTPNETLMTLWPEQFSIVDGLAYGWCPTRWHAGVVVYAVDGSGPLKRVGYYVSLGETLGAVAPLADGNMLFVGSNLHIVQPPQQSKLIRSGTSRKG